MFLKKIEIQGFKSFAQKTEIEFQGGITGVVGPNGSGKSNISDSIRWVLGEQSIKSLRGSKMEDVVFAGTDKRKPLGFAEVTLVLDNSSGRLPVEYSEVSVTRRVFRSGESEYYINKTSCRLKDIKELFMDTGVGKDGYSIVGQGRIDEILSTKSEDRRNIFEEAAGIVKYKTRKEEAEKKLERTQENLLRIDDIVNEIEKQIDPLKSQSEKAIKYKEVSEKLKKLQINTYIREIERIKEELNQIDTQKDLVIDQLQSSKKSKTEIESKYNLIKKEIEKMDFNIEKIQSNKYDAKNNIEKKDSEIKLINEKILYLNKEVNRYEEEMKSLKNNVEEIENQIKENEEKKLELDNKILGFNEKLNAKDNEFKELTKEIETKEKYIEDRKSHVIEVFNLIADKKSKINSLNSFKENIERRLSQISDELEQLNEYGEKIDKDISDNGEKIASNKDKLNAILLNRNEIYDKKNKELSRMEDTAKNINNIRVNLQGKTSNYKLLQDMKKEYEGYYRSVKNALIACEKDKNLGKGVRGVLAELISTPKKYEKAIEVALGSAIQNIVTETQEKAKDIIDYLKKNKLGRVTFLPMSSMSKRYLNTNEQKLLNQEGVVGVASELLKYNEEYTGIIEYLLGRVIVVNDIEDGIKVSKMCNYSLKIVSLDGDVLNPGGSMTGGSLNTGNTNLLGRERQIKELESEIIELNKEQETLTELQKDLESNIKTLENKLVEEDNNIADIKLLLAKIENKYAQNHDEKEKNKNMIDKYLLEQKSLIEESISIVKDTDFIDKELEDLKNQNNITQKNIEEHMKSFESEKIKKDNLWKEITELRVDKASLEQEFKNIIQTLNRLEENKKESLSNIDSKSIEKDKTLKDIEDLQLKQKESIDEKNSFSDLFRDYELKLNDIRADKNNFVQSHLNEEQKLNEINERVSELEKGKNTLELKFERYNIQYENYNNKMWDEYELSFQMALDYKIEVENFNEIQNEIKELKNIIKSLGNINLNAIEEYKNIKERHEFLTSQRDDLIEAKESLNLVIKDMDAKMKEQFKENFYIIRSNFIEVFAKLFGGGKADVYLQDEENILSCGIEIVAQPPGKKLQNLSLLSGGERALTAIALLFAILKTKPTPFCVLDEIEAALDDANVYRYAEYLREFSDSTQFIVITHRKGTMEGADSLYGVTMEEEGISKLVSVKLSDKEIGQVS
ncbi:chromosome segregation protein Smc [Gottschalkia acidurici 9a]|uniref:Chromosome partition protein Smc n=1 Tax=Gottschalkia acidurici (strain ATCC 7906 / DSM 604 / BCRC 14475 / CIP 104303 / KCTC 5404 / NCIMB 10678 / 9a) TaxID=1128398 RepID=K0B120_GOTA9|nr:chromosome segregation protein SMC [Gottschalkia acidurici]AFS78635.1 chromosome segregation protein Smc [Gottschalkia acidurici 9a]